MAWRLGIGNLISRSPASPSVVGCAEDPLYPLTEIGNGQPGDPARFVWESDGAYASTFDLNLLSASSARADAPSGWRDLALTLAGTPGLPVNPPEWGTFATRSAVKVYGSSFQDVDVMPGEDLLIECGLRRPTSDGSTATAARLVVLNLTTGEQWDGPDDQWNSGADSVARQAVADAWLDVSETITNTSAERVTYRIILVPEGGSYIYVSTPTLSAAQDFVALIGHNLPAGAIVTWSDGTVTRTLSGAWPSTYKHEPLLVSMKSAWTLSITMPSVLLDWTPAPFIGELWAGRLLDLGACPGYPFDITEGDIGQVRLEGGLGREAVYTEIERPLRVFKMTFKTTNQADYEAARDDFLRASRYGADPIILAPVASLEGDVIWHGRVGPDTTYSLVSRNKRTFSVSMRESPFPRFR